MNKEFENDVFFSYAHEDLEIIEKLATTLNTCGLTTFVADQNLRSKRRGTEDWDKALLNHITRCRFFVLYCSRAVSSSDWVTREAEHFYYECYSKDERRKMFVLVPPKCNPDIIPSILQNFLHSQSEDGLIRDVLTAQLFYLREEWGDTEEVLEEKAISLSEKLESATIKVREAFEHYGHKRFWEPLSRHRYVHIFTCGRETGYDPKDVRGLGGRTNIDKWDYQTVLEITHFFGENYPATQVTIEDPVAKLSSIELQGAQLGHQVASLMRQLEGKDCVIVGSPDVSDFAEIVFAELHGIKAFDEIRQKKRGFAIIKPQMKAPSSTYWVKKPAEAEGVAWIDGEKSFSISEENGIGETFGILVACNNPFSHKDEKHKIIILAGFTGLATYGIARLLTSEGCLNEFFKIDQRYGALNTNFEVLIGVRYLYDPEAKEGDSRVVEKEENSISVEAMVEIPRNV